MSCKIGKVLPWVLHRDDVVDIYKTFGKPFESAGKLKFRKNDNHMGISIRHKIIEGGASSVETPLSIVNYHTHPYQCYIDEKVIWGWPSGEDLRQAIIFALGGNLSHIVFCIEGIYVIEVNPCFLSFLRKLKPDDRSVIIAWIELMGKSTHELRGLNVNKIKKIRPEDWVKFVNNLKVNQTNTEQCGIITCNTVTVFNNNALVLSSLKNYLDDMYYNIELDTYKKNGTYIHSKKISKDKFRKALTEIRLAKFKCGKQLFNNQKWKKGHIFHVKFLKNKQFPHDDKPDNIFKWIQTKPNLEPPVKFPIMYKESISEGCNLNKLSSKIE